MAFIIPAGFGIARHVIEQAGKASAFVVTMGFSQTTGASPNPEGAATAIRDAWLDEDGPFRANGFSANFTYRGVEVTMGSETGPLGGSAPANLQGTLGANVLPPNCCVLVKKKTARGGRKGRGRNYWPCMWFGEGDVSSVGIIDPAIVTAVETEMQAALDLQAATNFPPMLLHEDGTTPNGIQVLEVSSLLATQRRRLRS